MTDQAGGAHCCGVYNVVSLVPKAHRLLDVGTGGAVDFQKDKDGKMVIWQRVGGTSGYTSEARRPAAEQVFRVRAGKRVDVTPQFCGQIFQPRQQRL